MGATITVDGDDYSDEAHRFAWEVGGMAANGERSLGHILLHNSHDSVSFTARKPWSIVEDATASPTYLGRGRVIGIQLQRGEGKWMAAEHEEIAQVEDQNSELGGLAFREPWVRPAETDVERVLALAADHLNGSPRASTVLATTYVAAGNTVNMPAHTYSVREGPNDVLTDCATEAGKIYFVTIDHELYYDVRGSTAYASVIQITDRDDEIDYETFWPAIWDLGPALDFLGQNIISGTNLTYGSGDDRYVNYDDAAAESQFDYWIEALSDSRATTAARALARATQYVNSRKRGERTYSLSLMFRDDEVDLVKAGQMIQIKSRVTDLPNDFQYRRIAELKWQRVGIGNLYMAHMFLDYPTRVVPLGGGDPALATMPKPAPACIPGSATEVYDNGEAFWPGSYPFTSSHCGPNFHNVGASGGNSSTILVDPSTGYALNLIIDANKHPYTLAIRYLASGTHLDTEYFVFGKLGTDNGVECVMRTASFTTPPTCNSIRVQFLAKLGGWRYQGTIDSLTPAGGDEDCIDYGDSPSESPDFLPADYVEDRLDDLEEQIGELAETAGEAAAGSGVHRGTELIASPGGGFEHITHSAAYYNDRTYIAYIRGDNGDACITYYDHLTGEVGPETIMRAALGADTHAAPAVLVRSDGVVMAFYCAHNGSALYQWTSTASEDISSGTEANKDSQLTGVDYTYPNVFQMGDGTLFMVVRNNPGGGSQHYWYYSTSANGTTWAALTEFFTVAGNFGYLSPRQTGPDRIDFSVQDDSAVTGNPIGLYHFYRDGSTWHKSDGTAITGLPFDHNDFTQVVSNAGRGWDWTSQGDICGVSGELAMTFVAYDGADYITCWARWTGASWEVAEIDDAAAPWPDGGARIDQRHPNIVYASRLVSAVQEMYRYLTPDNGATWIAESLTQGSGEKNTRPVSVTEHGGLPVVWMRGTWTSATSFAAGTYGMVDHAHPHTHSARAIPYDGTDSGLAANDVQAAIDELSTAGVVGALDDLSDVAITSPAAYDALQYNGSAWVNVPGAFVVDPGSVSYAGATPTITLTSVFGIDGSGNPYYNAADVTSGEEAALMRNPATGEYFLRSYNF